jgi:ribosomal protein S18 acetylase RimI-like enzyme
VRVQGHPSIRAALPSDIEFLQRMLYEAANKPGEPWPSLDQSMAEPRNRRFWDGLMTRDSDLGVIAEVEGLPVGAAWIRAMGEGERGPDDDPDVPVLAIGVEREHRGRGIGSTLMQSLLDLARASGIRAIDLTTGSFNAPAVRLYHRSGFQDVGSSGNTIRMRATLA